MSPTVPSGSRRKHDNAPRRDGQDGAPKLVSNLDGVSETMLWTLYDRACEARRRDSDFDDVDSVRICDGIDYDFAGHFGKPDGSFAARAAEIDHLLMRWLERHPDGLVVSLGEGLETQARRVDNGRMNWLTVDLPAAIELRERFLPSCRRFRHIGSNVLDVEWMDGIEAGAPVFVIAQGLFMYLEPDAVKHLFIQIAERLPGAEIAFDVIPRWFSQLTLLGVMQTPHYRLPPMPWGVNGDEIEAQLRAWSSSIGSLRVLAYGAPRGWPKLTEDLFRANPLTQRHLPYLVHVTLDGY
ncbi:putative O-methyltransferase OmT (plasmid) [Paraburkholderia sp. PGU19]|uniref:class I SAM-dependent methyltransferase n=1 Tax=Paraburkholderia sp. PGU19 TaxID=2735434 RepID=UPI0015DD2E2E|nr:class I SAM-dependent methyltransferase [Paraburkholderia sp. PGU19]BCG05532.1 putative O-methyltransferase OmT [Paraburkholderia sp. PGU19]